jgi:nitrite reductase (NADH) small subunit
VWFGRGGVTSFSAVSQEIRAGAVSDFEDGVRRLVTVGDRTIGVFAHAGEMFAYLNVCPHQGGPVCEGVIVGKVETELKPGGHVGLGRFSETETHLACPWHGVEFNIRTGVCWSDQRLRLRSYEVTTRDGEVFVRV